MLRFLMLHWHHSLTCFVPVATANYLYFDVNWGERSFFRAISGGSSQAKFWTSKVRHNVEK